MILGAGMASVRRDGDDLAVELDDGRQLRPDALLFAAGRSVSTTGLGLEEAGSRSTGAAGSSWTPSGGPAARGSSPPAT